MKVWIVTYDYGPPHGSSNLRVFDSKEKAFTYIKQCIDVSVDYGGPCSDVEEFEVE